VGVEIRFITGMMVGVELVQQKGKNVFIIDICILRLLVFFL